MQFKKKIIAGALAAGLVMGAGGIAAAYFTAGGAGTGSATVGTPATFSVTGGTVSTLLPGSPQTATFTVTNTQAFSKAFTGATASVTESSPTCDITVGTPSPTFATVAASGTTTVTVVVTMATNATYTQGSCTATVHLSL